MFTRELPKDAEGLRDYVRRLQQHFSLRDDTDLPGALMVSIDEGILSLLERAQLDYIGYVKSKGDLESDDKIGMIDELRQRLTKDYGNLGRLRLEMRLRVFAELCELCEKSYFDSNSAEAEAVVALLRPVAEIADRHSVMLAHRSSEVNVFPKS